MTIQWMREGIPVTVMLERVRKDPQNPYQGGNSIFYQQVQFIRREKKIAKQKAIWRFEGLPGEYPRVRGDWGEKRQFPFTQIPRTTRYCFVGRMKYSRWIYVEFHDNMRYETLIRCILRCFENLGGVPWVLVFDNMSTVVRIIAERDKDGNPVWNQRFRQFASEIGFHPEVCDPGAANQKGTVENGVNPRVRGGSWQDGLSGMMRTYSHSPQSGRRKGTVRSARHMDILPMSFYRRNRRH